MTSDWHLGHKGISQRFRTNFKTDAEHDEAMLDMYLSTVTKRDIVWFLGDIAFDEVSLARVRALPGIKNLVLGNHDTDQFSKKLDIAQIVLAFDNVHGLYSYKHAWLSHAPIHPDELRGKINVHGHTHNYVLPDNRYFNVCPEVNDYKLVKFQYILAKAQQKPKEKCSGCMTLCEGCKSGKENNSSSNTK